jgi:hypothetical protein
VIRKKRGPGLATQPPSKIECFVRYWQATEMVVELPSGLLRENFPVICRVSVELSDQEKCVVE